MCGRFALYYPVDELISLFDLSRGFPFEDRYNIAPSQEIPIIRQVEGERRLALARWGLIPFWADEEKIGYKMINARAESVASKPSFRAAFRSRRCIIPASGFFEWQKIGGDKQPYYLYRADGNPLALAGLWERWENPKDSSEMVESCTIITTEANDMVAKLHNRMPAILEKKDFDAWLDPDREKKDLLALLRPAAKGALDLHPVSTVVNKPTNEGADCIRPSSNRNGENRSQD